MNKQEKIEKARREEIRALKMYGYLPKRKNKNQRCKHGCHDGDGDAYWWNGAKYRPIVVECRVCNFKNNKHGKPLTEDQQVAALHQKD